MRLISEAHETQSSLGLLESLCFLPHFRRAYLLQGAGMQNLTFFPLGSCGWAVTIPLAGTQSSGTCLHPPARPSPQPCGCHPLCTGNSNHPPGRDPVFPLALASPPASTLAECPHPARNPLGLPLGYPTLMYTQLPLDAVSTTLFLQNTGSPNTLPTLLGWCLTCTGYL